MINERVYKGGMSTSNIGGRKNKSSCDHLFVAHEIINSVINWEGEDTDFLIYDNRKAFDKLDLEGSSMEIVDTLPMYEKDD